MPPYNNDKFKKVSAQKRIPPLLLDAILSLFILQGWNLFILQSRLLWSVQTRGGWLARAWLCLCLAFASPSTMRTMELSQIVSILFFLCWPSRELTLNLQSKQTVIWKTSICKHQLMLLALGKSINHITTQVLALMKDLIFWQADMVILPFSTSHDQHF